MTCTTTRIMKLTLALATVSALGACKPSDRTANADTAAARTDSAAGRLDSTATAAGNSMSDSTHAMANKAGAWTNDHIFGFTHNADNGEIALGKLASTKATNPQVKAYAREMVKDHQTMMAQSHALMGKLKATPDSTWDDAKGLADNGRDKLKELTDKAAGADWDKNYIQSQIDTHQKVLDKLTDAAKSATDSTVTNGLAKATSMVQEHLTKAQTLNSTLK
jgi:putative membrane protein